MRSPRKIAANTTVTTGIRYNATVQRTVPSVSQAMFHTTNCRAYIRLNKRPEEHPADDEHGRITLGVHHIDEHGVEAPAQHRTKRHQIAERMEHIKLICF